MDILLNIWEYILVFILAAVPWLEIAFIIPVSILAGMNAFWVAVMAFAGNLLTVYLLIIFFDRLKDWWMKRRKKKESTNEKRSKYERAEQLWHKYGVPGLTISGPLLIGSHIAAATAILLGTSQHRTLYWMTISLIGWTLVLTFGTVFGVDLFTK